MGKSRLWVKIHYWLWRIKVIGRTPPHFRIAGRGPICGGRQEDLENHPKWCIAEHAYMNYLEIVNKDGGGSGGGGGGGSFHYEIVNKDGE